MSYKDSIEYYKKSIQYTKYSEAEKLFEDGNYLEAAEAFRLLGSFEKSETKCTESLYTYAISLFNSEDYEEAFAIFQESTQLRPYKTFRVAISNMRYIWRCI